MCRYDYFLGYAHQTRTRSAAGNFLHVPMLTGTTANEIYMFHTARYTCLPCLRDLRSLRRIQLDHGTSSCDTNRDSGAFGVRSKYLGCLCPQFGYWFDWNRLRLAEYGTTKEVILLGNSANLTGKTIVSAGMVDRLWGH